MNALNDMTATDQALMGESERILMSNLKTESKAESASHLADFVASTPVSQGGNITAISNVVNTTTITAATSREALRLVREKLGPDAVIISNRVTPQGVEIVAFVEGDVFASAVLSAVAPAIIPMISTTPSTPSEQLVAPINIAAVPPLPQPLLQTPVIKVDDSPTKDSVLTELQSMRGMIEEQLAGLAWNEKQRRDPVRSHLLRMLLGAGFSARLAKAMLDHLPTGRNYASGMAWVKAELARNLPVLEDENALLDNGGVYALMGPTGVGKTTTTAKLAARCVMRFGPEKLALLTTDTYRIGAYEQLRIYGQILGVSVHAVKDAVDLRLVLDDLRDKHMVLIDTVGKSQRDRSVAEQVAMLCGTGHPVKRLLLLNASSHGDTLNEVVHAYRQDIDGGTLAGCIFTKMDEATHPGALLDTAIRHRLPVHYVSTGQKVPENLIVANRSELVESVFQSASRSALFVPGEADLKSPLTPLPEIAQAAALQAAAHEAQTVLHTATTERLRMQCRQLIRALSNDSVALRANAAALAAGGIGFDATRSLRRQLDDKEVSATGVTQTLMTHARHEIAVGCNEVVLAIGGKVTLNAAHSGDAYMLHGGLLLSDSTGMALAAPRQILTTAVRQNPVTAEKASASSPVLRQLSWLQQQDFGKPVIHVLDSLPPFSLLIDQQNSSLQWLARGRASTSVIFADTLISLTKLADKLHFGSSEPIIYKGKAALQSLAEITVGLRNLQKKGDTTIHCQVITEVRCVVTRIIDLRSGKSLAQWHLLSNLGQSVAASQMIEWYRWRVEADTYFKLLKQAIQQSGGCGEPGDADMMKRLLIAGQTSVTVWRLQRAQAEWAPSARALLAHLAGRSMRMRMDGISPVSAAVSGTVLLEGLEKCLVLMDVLDTGVVSLQNAAKDMPIENRESADSGVVDIDPAIALINISAIPESGLR
ncbi:flagellar biosynthesis protein FlhF [Glaciimonas sp. CA11.2]|uniref:flagellar biosynthesis protein FlhF n=1 Tax=unclassified Glaciimonas TaxID=2644401 RepID=UPI002B3DDDC8|nr:flagellar biosynthesis protein FlhF [Glaciimonas sp. Cout2]MEB0083840.1 flagellar biosynthesis protein FlhF [Glaciimonas sp. Gout2]MEB0163473.1 flagellar biosynthesis protein FlhF [Glaciimonas sp. CA11.2]